MPSKGAPSPGADRLDTAAAVGRPTALAPAGGAAALAAAIGGSAALLPAHGPASLLRLPPSASGKPITALAASQDGRLVAAGGRGSKPAVYLFAAAGTEPAQELGKGFHTFGIAALAFSPSGRLLASQGADRDHQFALWETASGRPAGRERLKLAIDALAFVGEERCLGIAPNMLVVWSLERDNKAGGAGLPYKLTPRTYPLPACPAPARMLGLVSLPPAAPRAPPRLLAATDGGRVLRLRAGGPPVERSLEMQAGRAHAMAASARHMALACGAGIRLLDAATLEPAGELALPTAATADGCAPGSTAAPRGVGVVEACAFSADGCTLTASTSRGALLAWDVSDAARSVLLRQRQLHSEAITGAVALPCRDGSTQLATCSADGRVLLWRCAADGSGLEPCASFDVRAHLEAPATHLLCLAASPDGSMLAAGDGTGGLHLLSLLPPGGTALLASHQPLCNTEVTAVAWGCDPPSAPTSPAAGVLLAVGGRNGSVKLLRLQPHRNAMEVLAEARDHKAAVSGLAFVQGGAAGGVGLASADREGRRVLYSWNAAQGQLRVAGTATAPRGSFVGLEAAQGGAALLAVSSAGRATVLEACTGRERGTAQLLGSTHGEATCAAVDAGLTLACVATTRNLVLAFALPSGKLLASCRAHTAGMAVNKLVALPGCIVSVGDDAAVHTHTLPAAIAARCGQAAERYRPELPAAPPAEPASSSSSGGSSSSALRPTDLSLLLEGALADSPAPAPTAPPAAAPPAPAAVLGRAASITIPPSPNRAKLLAGQERQRAQLEALQATFAALPGRKAHAQDTEVPPSPPAAAPSAAAAGTPPAVLRAATAQSPGPVFVSPVELLADVSPLASVCSPDVFADLPSPPPTGGPGSCPPASALSAAPAAAVVAPAIGPPVPSAAAAAPLPGAGAAPQPKPVGRSSFGGKLQRLVGWHRPPAGSSRIIGGADPAPAGQHSDPLAAADLARAAAILGGEPLRQPAFDSPTAFASPLSATVDVGGLPAAAAATGGESTVQQPSRRRRGWGSRSNASGAEAGDSLGLEPPRRALSALSLRSISDGLGGGVPRPRSACDEAPHTGDSFDIADGSPSDAPTHRRLSFEFSFNKRGARPPSASSKDEDTPTMLQQRPKAQAPPQPPAAFSLDGYSSPGLHAPEAAPQGSGQRDSTPRLFLGRGAAGPAPAATATLSVSPPAAAQPPSRPPGTACSGAGAPARPPPEAHPLPGRPSVPRLNLGGPGPCGAPAAPPAITSGKRSRLARQGTLPAEPSAGAGAGGTSSSQLPRGGLRRQVPASVAEDEAGEGSTPARSKKGRLGGHSPPRNWFTCDVFSPQQHSADRDKAPVRASPTGSGSASSRRLSQWRSMTAGGRAASTSGPASHPLSGGSLLTEDDPFCRPASHDPLLADEEAQASQAARQLRAVRGVPQPEASIPCSTAARPASPASTTPASTPPASSASSCSSDASEEEEAEVPHAPGAGTGAAGVLATLRQAREQLACLMGSGTPLDAAACAEVRALAAEVLRLMPLAGTGAPAERAGAAIDRENAAPAGPAASGPAVGAPVCGAGAPWAADIEAMRRAIVEDVLATISLQAR